MNKISQFTLKGRDVEMLYQNGFLAYSFEYKGNPYGTKIKLPSKSVIDIASVTFQLLTNALETMETLEKDNA